MSQKWVNYREVFLNVELRTEEQVASTSICSYEQVWLKTVVYRIKRDRILVNFLFKTCNMMVHKIIKHSFYISKLRFNYFTTLPVCFCIVVNDSFWQWSPVTKTVNLNYIKPKSSTFLTEYYFPQIISIKLKSSPLHKEPLKSSERNYKLLM